MQIPTALHFGRTHALEPFHGLMKQDPIIQHARRVNDAFERRQRLACGEHPHDIVALCHITPHDLHRGPSLLHLRDSLLDGGPSGPATPGERQMARTLRDQPPGNLQPQATQTAGDQIATLGVDESVIARAVFARSNPQVAMWALLRRIVRLRFAPLTMLLAMTRVRYFLG